MTINDLIEPGTKEIGLAAVAPFSFACMVKRPFSGLAAESHPGQEIAISLRQIRQTQARKLSQENAAPTICEPFIGRFASPVLPIHDAEDVLKMV